MCYLPNGSFNLNVPSKTLQPEQIGVLYNLAQ
jgi:hypothetical protein